MEFSELHKEKTNDNKGRHFPSPFPQARHCALSHLLFRTHTSPRQNRHHPCSQICRLRLIEVSSLTEGAQPRSHSAGTRTAAHVLLTAPLSPPEPVGDHHQPQGPACPSGLLEVQQTSVSTRTASPPGLPPPLPAQLASPTDALGAAGLAVRVA